MQFILVIQTQSFKESGFRLALGQGRSWWGHELRSGTLCAKQLIELSKRAVELKVAKPDALCPLVLL